MPDTLLTWSNLHAGGPERVRERLQGRPVLYYEPREEAPGLPESPGAAGRPLRTGSGLERPALAGAEPLATIVEKTRENVFKERITIGRTGNNDLSLEDSSVSRFHAWLEQDRAGWLLVDAGSRNGTFLGGRRLVARTPARLANQAALRIGVVPLIFYTAEGFLEVLRQRA